MSHTEVNKENSDQANRSFHFTIKWSVIIFTLFILIGFLFRFINPTELRLDSSEYIQKVFTQERIKTWNDSSQIEEPAGMFEPGSILYVIHIDKEWAMVRPLRVSFLDSVWVKAHELSLYEEETYRAWAREYERNIVSDM